MAEQAFLQQAIEWFFSFGASAKELAKHVGWPLATLIIGVAAVAFLWWKSKDIKERPGVEPLIKRLTLNPSSKARANRLTIAVAQLGNDKDREHERLLLDELGHFEGVETISAERIVDSSTQDRPKTESAARSLLKQTGADVLIWGSVISLGGKGAMRLYWTPSGDISGAAFSGKYQPQTDTLTLPLELWNDLKQVLGLHIQSRVAELTFGLTGHYVGDRLAPLINQVRALLKSPQGVWNPGIQAGVRFSLATALALEGEQSGKNESLAESIALYRAVLNDWTRAGVPLKWARTQNNLGNALAILGERKNQTALLDEAVTAYQAALEERTRVRAPLDWAMTQRNLGNALQALGGGQRGTALLKDAVTAYREALQEYTRESAPLEWARTQNNLGNALATIGGREKGTVRLQEAVAAYREALKELTRARVPLQWAATQHNLGTALATIGERESGTAWLQEAVVAYHEALKEFTQERVPLQWAETQNNLGNAIQTLGARERGTAHLEEAVAAYREALKELTRDRRPLDWTITVRNLGEALWRLGKRGSGREQLGEAVRRVEADTGSAQRRAVSVEVSNVAADAASLSRVDVAMTGRARSRRPLFRGFFSYSHHDAEVDPSIVDAFFSELEKRVDARLVNARYEVWRDIKNLRVGDYWDESIETAIKSAHIFIVFLTPKWISSNYCRKELEAFESVESTRNSGGYVILILVRDIKGQARWLEAGQADLYDRIMRRQYQHVTPTMYAHLSDGQKIELIEKVADSIYGMICRLRDTQGT